MEMHHPRVDQACTGDNVGLNIKDLDKNNMSRSGDVMVDKKDRTLGRTKEFNAQFQVLDIPNVIKEDYSPIDSCDATVQHSAFQPLSGQGKGNWRC